MAALVEGVEYGLSSRSVHSANKSLFHVKLTDSAFKAIEEFKSVKGGTNKRATIQINGASGVIKVPSKKGSDDSQQVFRLSVGAYQGDPKGSFDCIQQKSYSSGDSLELLGSLTHKVSIHANEDSYKTTREKMALVEEQQKKSSAKEIKPSGPNIGKRVKIIKKNSPIAPSVVRPQDRLSPIDPVKSCYNTPGSGARYSGTTSVSPVPQQHSNKVPSHDQRSHNKTPTNPHQKSAQGTTPSCNSQQQNSKPPPANPEMMRKPLRERIIHLLALKPYKKPEIMVKLRTEGIKDKDKNQIGAVLKQVGVFNTRENAFSLAKHLYTEVRMDWPGYRDQDKQHLKKKQNLEDPPLSSTPPPPPSVSPAVSPVHSIGSQGSPTNTQQKRPAGTCDDAGPYPKKQRIAHGPKKSSRPNSPSVQILAPTPMVADTSKECGSETKPDKGNLSISSCDQSISKGQIDDTKRPKNPTSTHVTSSKKKEEGRRKSYQPSVTTETQAMEVGQETNNNSKTDQENLDFINEYHKIESLEQRQKCKQSFNIEYEEYRQLHRSVEKVTRVFQDLREQLYREEEGSPNYESIKDKIVEEYKELKKDPDYTKNRQRCDYLHKKLAHIKRCILEFDNSGVS